MEKELNIIYNTCSVSAEGTLKEKGKKKSDRIVHVVTGLSLFTMVKENVISPEGFYKESHTTLSPSAPEWDIAWNTFFAVKKLTIPEELSEIVQMEGCPISAGWYLFKDYMEHLEQKGDIERFIDRHRIKRIPHEVKGELVTLAHLVEASWAYASSYRKKNRQIVVLCNETGFQFEILNRLKENSICGIFYSNPQEDAKKYFGQILNDSFDMFNFFEHAKKSWPDSSRYWNVLWNHYSLDWDHALLVPYRLDTMLEVSVGRYLFAHLLQWVNKEKKEIEDFKKYHLFGKYNGSCLYPSLLEIKNADWSNFYKNWGLSEEVVITLYQNFFVYGKIIGAKPSEDEFTIEIVINENTKRITRSRDMIGKRRSL